jgi:hypothetical protein
MSRQPIKNVSSPASSAPIQVSPSHIGTPCDLALNIPMLMTNDLMCVQCRLRGWRLGRLMYRSVWRHMHILLCLVHPFSIPAERASVEIERCLHKDLPLASMFIILQNCYVHSVASESFRLGLWGTVLIPSVFESSFVKVWSIQLTHYK